MNKQLDKLYELIGSLIYTNAPQGFIEAFVAADIVGASTGGFEMGAKDGANRHLKMDMDIHDLLELQSCFVRVRDELLRETGDRVWSLRAAVNNEGRFSISHGYEIPTWHDEEEDPLVAWEDNNLSFESSTANLREWERQGLAWLQQRSAEDQEAWGLGSEKNWSLDLQAGRLNLTFADGRIMSGQIHVLGTFNKNDGSFLWAWNNSSIPEELCLPAEAIRNWAQANGEHELVQPKMLVDEMRIWAWLGFSARETGGDGGYRVSSGETEIYLTYRGITSVS